MLEHTSGIATRTRRLVLAARAVNPGIAMLTTRKFFPGTNRLSLEATLWPAGPRPTAWSSPTRYWSSPSTAWGRAGCRTSWPSTAL